MRYQKVIDYEELREMAKRYGNFHPETEASLAEMVDSISRRFPFPGSFGRAMAEYIEQGRPPLRVDEQR